MIAPINYRPIGVIRSPHTVFDKTPIQPVFAGGFEGRVEVDDEFAPGLTDIEGFSHLYLVYHLHEVGPTRLMTKPFLQDVERGIFATRAPWRPNPIGISVVELVRREGNVLVIDGVDVLDGTPLLDIKPYCSRFDVIEGTRDGWYLQVDEADAQARGRRNLP